MGAVNFLPVAEHQDETKAAYDGIVELYASMFANRLETQPFSRNMIGTFAELVRGTGNPRAADVGCGPGHLTAMLHDLGLDAFGLDLSPAMVDHARRAHPTLRFDEARMEALPVEDGALVGVWPLIKNREHLCQCRQTAFSNRVDGKTDPGVLHREPTGIVNDDPDLQWATGRVLNKRILHRQRERDHE
jgi:SAM-dependent methyltransferase